MASVSTTGDSIVISFGFVGADIFDWSLYPYRFNIPTTIIGASDCAGFVIKAFKPNTIEDSGYLKGENKIDRR